MTIKRSETPDGENHEVMHADEVDEANDFDDILDGIEDLDDEELLEKRLELAAEFLQQLCGRPGD